MTKLLSFYSVDIEGRVIEPPTTNSSSADTFLL